MDHVAIDPHLLELAGRPESERARLVHRIHFLGQRELLAGKGKELFPAESLGWLGPAVVDNPSHGDGFLVQVHSQVNGLMTGAGRGGFDRGIRDLLRTNFGVTTFVLMFFIQGFRKKRKHG